MPPKVVVPAEHTQRAEGEAADADIPAQCQGLKVGGSFFFGSSGGGGGGSSSGGGVCVCVCVGGGLWVSLRCFFVSVRHFCRLFMLPVPKRENPPLQKQKPKAGVTTPT